MEVDGRHNKIYPSIAMSDCFFALANAYAAHYIKDVHYECTAWLGLTIVATTGVFGVLRFGYSPRLFEEANVQFSGLCIFLGYPLIALDFIRFHTLVQMGLNDVLLFVVLSATLATVARSFSQLAQLVLFTLFSTVFFVIPMIYISYISSDVILMSAIGLFVIAGVILTPDVELKLWRYRRVDIFHYLAGVMALMVASRINI
jgi:hypothetical protein